MTVDRQCRWGVTSGHPDDNFLDLAAAACLLWLAQVRPLEAGGLMSDFTG
jgi:hypothetical protein